MNLYKAALVSGLFTLVWSGAGWAAAEVPRGAIALWKGDDQWVRIEQQDDPAASPNDHPAHLDTAAVASALGALRIRVVDPDSGAETERIVFTHEELGNLVPPVTSGLARAGPRQDVTFSTIGSHSRGTGSLIKDPSVNAGRVFYEDGKLNVIFGELQANYRKRNVYGRMDEDFEVRRQGTRTKANKLSWPIATLPGITLHATSDGGVRNDWVTIDPAVAGSQTAAAPQAADVAPGSPSSALPARQPLQPTPPATVAAPAPVVDAAAGPAAATAPGPATGKTSADLERRLRILKDLKDKGLISEEAYKARMHELLSEL